MKRALLFAAIASLAMPAMAATPAPVSITSCGTFRTWFAQQPGWRLTLPGVSTVLPVIARPKKPDTILTYGPYGAAVPTASWSAGMKRFEGPVGGGGCLSGYYDASTQTALILSSYDTASDLLITKTTNEPLGLPSHAVVLHTKNGAAIGMTLEQIRAIEGNGTLSTVAGSQELLFKQDLGPVAASGRPEEYGWLRFLFQGGRVTAIDVGAGE
jgi:hypothetical protein